MSVVMFLKTQRNNNQTVPFGMERLSSVITQNATRRCFVGWFVGRDSDVEQRGEMVFI